MEINNIYTVAKHVVLAKSKVKNIEVSSGTNLEEDLGLDSLDIVELTVDIEQAIPGYGVDESELCNIRSFGDLVAKIKPLFKNSQN